MSTRITSNMVARSVLADLNAVSARLTATQQRLATGKQITKPSDDPFATGKAISMRSELAGIKQYQRNVSDATAWLDITDTALGSVQDAAQRARELLVQGASDTSGPTARANIADEIDQLIEAVRAAGNTTYDGRYVFGGTATQTRPYDTGSDAYAGNTAQVVREVGVGVSVPINVTADEFLGSGQAAGDGKLLQTLRDISAHLRGGTTADSQALKTTDLQAMDANLDTLSRLRARVGATTNRVETASSRLDQLEQTATKLLSQTEDADMAQTIIDFSTQQSVYQAALRAGASIVQTSLLDFLR